MIFLKNFLLLRVKKNATQHQPKRPHDPFVSLTESCFKSWKSDYFVTL
ncbi:hypothetical protein CSC02_1143 [Enterobacter hormaechei subsp. hoffmannii]|nr:hypothetical protein CSC02_1143 [Enterobacter hormaechei subsp. hoffmannii]